MQLSISAEYLGPVPFICICRVTRAPQADLDHSLTVQKTVLHTTSEWSPMSNLLTQDDITGVSMSIHMDQTHRSIPGK